MTEQENVVDRNRERAGRGGFGWKDEFDLGHAGGSEAEKSDKPSD